MSCVVVPAVLTASREDLQQKLVLFARLPLIDTVQIDVVDGHFASPPSWPYSANEPLSVLGTLPYLDRITYEIDLMCEHPETAIEGWLALGASRLTFHIESTRDAPRLLASVRRRYGTVVSFGLALNIATDLALLELCVGDLDYVQLMGIAQIGRQGQLFDSRVLSKIRTLHSKHPSVPIQIDGGVSLATAKDLFAAGASHLVVGSALLKAADPAAAVAAFESLTTPYGV